MFALGGLHLLAAIEAKLIHWIRVGASSLFVIDRLLLFPCALSLGGNSDLAGIDFFRQLQGRRNWPVTDKRVSGQPARIPITRAFRNEA